MGVVTGETKVWLKPQELKSGYSEQFVIDDYNEEQTAWGPKAVLTLKALEDEKEFSISHWNIRTAKKVEWSKDVIGKTIKVSYDTPKKVLVAFIEELI